MGVHGHEPPYKVPPYSQFQIQGIPQLEELEQALAKKGLRDPWIRNEAWRYHPGFGTKWQRARKVFFRGFGIGLGLTVVAVGAEKLLSGGDKHGHDEH
ncbi:NADH dehydrogenase [ubiquinone] 1 beta subcomplex subunit 3 [Achroia grisella]|uniref:NADH dehydrogenase [ubiquinone] 1 beta subcomplex subunit 3 n=1 Tax=Achroia grisella TaxID=688607 RepID=UPI0027D1FCA4|nr:NADH dehydrogenase [ubiquinone] 1 beta subcomplex subunit 3 [Achroia grisella]XP_059055914.1 NADH dehydrogenase [ubiquinone] 1 beta subcomplex subunit 3 [Achroia grisella]